MGESLVGRAVSAHELTLCLAGGTEIFMADDNTPAKGAKRLKKS